MHIEKIKEDLIGWKYNQEERYLGNPAFGRIQLVSVCDETGREIYQQPVWLEQEGENDIIVNEDQKIAFVEIVRHAVIPPVEYAKKWNEWKPPKGNVSMLIPHPLSVF